MSVTRVQPVLTPTELALVDQMAELTRSKRTDVIKSALAVYHWFVRQALTGSTVVASPMRDVTPAICVISTTASWVHPSALPNRA